MSELFEEDLPIEIEEEEDLPIEIEEEKLYLNRGCIGKDFYENYIKDKYDKKVKSKFEKILQDEDNYIDYYRVGIENPSDNKWEFSQLWFFDINLDIGYMPCFISGINTSSCLALELCGMDGDDEDDEDNWKTMEELMEFAPNGSNKSKMLIKKILTLKSN